MFVVIVVGIVFIFLEYFLRNEYSIKMYLFRVYICVVFVFWGMVLSLELRIKGFLMLRICIKSYDIFRSYLIIMF